MIDHIDGLNGEEERLAIKSLTGEDPVDIFGGDWRNEVEELGNNGEPVVDESKEIDLAMDTYEPEHDHDRDVRDEQESTDRWLSSEEDKYLSSFSN